MQKNTNQNRKTKKGLIIFLILFVILYVIIYIVPKVTDIFTPTYIAEYGTLEVGEEAECVFVRDEEVYKASASGTVERTAEEGALVREGTLVVTLNGQEQLSGRRGIVSYYYDGYERKLTPENMADLEESFIAQFKEEGQVQKTPSGSVEAGSTMYKIIANSNWYLVCWLSEEKAGTFQVGRDVTVSFDADDSDAQVTMTLDTVTEDKGKQKLIFSCNRNYDEFDRYRIRTCKIIASGYSGVILNKDSICEVDGTKGVYVVDKFGNNNFTPVYILSSYEDKVVAQNNFFYNSEGEQVATVRNYDEILKAAKN